MKSKVMLGTMMAAGIMTLIKTKSPMKFCFFLHGKKWCSMKRMTDLPEYPEPQGYSNSPSFVKSNPANNPSYLQKSIAVFPELKDTLTNLDRAIENIAPGYNIAQIKEKFGGLRYYLDLPEGTTPEVREQVWALVSKAEREADPLLREARGL